MVPDTWILMSCYYGRHVISQSYRVSRPKTRFRVRTSCNIGVRNRTSDTNGIVFTVMLLHTISLCAMCEHRRSNNVFESEQKRVSLFLHTISHGITRFAHPNRRSKSMTGEVGMVAMICFQSHPFLKIAIIIITSHLY